MLDPWIAQTNRALKTHRRRRELLGVLITFLVVGGSAAVLGVIIGMPRTVVIVETPTTVNGELPPQYSMPEVGVSPSRAQVVGGVIVHVHGRDRMTQGSGVRVVPYPSATPP